MAATAQDGGEQGLEIMGVPQGEGVGQQAETSLILTENLLDTHASSKNTSSANRMAAEDSPAADAQPSAGTDRAPGVENGTDLDYGPVDSYQDTSTQQNYDESTSKQDDKSQQISADLSDVPQDASPGQPQKKTTRSRKNPTPKKVPTPPKSATPLLAQSEEATPQKKRRGRKPKGEILSPIENPLTSTPVRTPQNQQEAPEEQGMTPTPQKKKRGRKPKGGTLHPPENPLTSTPARTPQNQHEAAEEQEMTPTPQKKKRGRKPKGWIWPPTDNVLTSTPAPVDRNQQEVPVEQELTSSGRPKRRAAKVALEYLHSLAEDVDGPSFERKVEKPASDRSSVRPKEPAQTKVRKGRKRKTLVRDNSDASGDEDFVPGSEGESEEEAVRDDDSVSSFEKEPKKPYHSQNKSKFPGKASNGLMNSLMGPIWCCAAINKQFREKHFASWVFPEWIPSTKDWHFLSESDAEKYLPKEEESPAFRISREGLREDGTPCRINRFESLPFHPERWDMCFFVGGPVWSMEWCPCPDGGTSSQFAAIYCNKGMDDQHSTTGTHSEPALLQIWDLGELQYDACPSSPPQLAYAIALDDGCVWDMKWCPSSAWELPTTCRKVPHMARLGLLATALSSGKIAVYSLPHRDALTATRRSQANGEVCQAPLICQVQSVAVLKVGSVQAGDTAQAGQCFCLDWLPVKPHNIVAAGFFDGSVALWNLNTKSLLQRVRASDGSVTLYPFHSFIAHDHTVQTLTWCKASSDLLATAGDDRKLKFWDLRKTYVPVSIHRRYLTTEICWPLIWSGIFVGQQSCYATFGQHGIHYLDAGYLGYKPYFMAPRKGTIWSISFSDWLNTCLMADTSGELIMVLLPELTSNLNNLKRTVERRFPVFRAELAQFPGSERDECGQEPQTYSEAVKKYYLHFHDMDMRTFRNAHQRAPFKHMQAHETKGVLSLDKVPLASLYKVRLNPNLCCQSWVLSAGQSGLVRAHCLQAMNSAVIGKMARESEAQFAAMYPPQGDAPDHGGATAVRHSTESTVQVV